MTTEASYRLYQTPGWGSAIVELQLAHYGLACDLVEVGDLFAAVPGRARLEALNPLGQIPTLVLPSGAVMTESAAITLHLADLAGRDDLVPGPEAVERAAFLRWLIFLVANIYPAVSYDDNAPALLPETAVVGFRAALAAQKKRLWRQVADGVGGPWVLGDRFSALDLYVAVMTRWQPGRAWFAAELPQLVRIADAVAARPALAPAYRRNFP